MGRYKETPFQKWSYHATPQWYSILQELALLEDFSVQDGEQENIRDLAKRARMALEAPNLGGSPPYPWQTTKIV
jgi:hypothetical protein